MKFLKHPSITFTLLCICFIMMNGANAKSLGHHWTVNGLDQPESVVFDPQNNRLIVSNINGTSLELNGKGYLSLIGLDREIIQKQWVTGLNAPKGESIFKGNVYIADMQTLHIVDAKSGAIKQ